MPPKGSGVENMGEVSSEKHLTSGLPSDAAPGRVTGSPAPTVLASMGLQV